MSVEEYGSERVIDVYLERYFVACPNAADTVEGILAWWLPHALAHVTPAELTDALERLVAAGRLQRSLMPNGRVVYSKPQSQSGAMH